MAWQLSRQPDILSRQLKHLPCRYVAMSPCRHVLVLGSWFLIQMVSRWFFFGDRPVRNLSKRHARDMHDTSCAAQNKDFLTLHLGVTCFCCDGFLQNLHSHSVKANARRHDAAWDAGNRTPHLLVAQLHCAISKSHG